MAYDGKDKVLEEVTGKSYEFGFTTEIEIGQGSSGPDRGHYSADIQQKRRAGLAFEMEARSFCGLANHGGAGLGLISIM